MTKRKKTSIDGEIRIVDPDLNLEDIVSPDVSSIVTHDGLIRRSEFTKVPIPDSFEQNLSGINRG